MGRAVFNIFRSHPRSTDDAQFQQKLPDYVRRLEAALYRTAASKVLVLCTEMEPAGMPCSLHCPTCLVIGAAGGVHRHIDGGDAAASCSSADGEHRAAAGRTDTPYDNLTERPHLGVLRATTLQHNCSMSD